MTKQIKQWIGSVLALSIVLSLLVTSASAQTQQPSSKVTAKTANLTLIDWTTDNSDWQPVLVNYIKVANQKDLFITAALEAGLYTQTLVKSKNMVSDTSTARAVIQVRVLIDDNVDAPVEPGVVTYADRYQELTATLEGAISGCLSIDPITGGIILDPTCVTPEEIGLILSTLNAASFSFVAVDVPQGIHKISVQARITSTGSAQQGSWKATGLVGKGTVTVESVRLIKGEDVPEL